MRKKAIGGAVRQVVDQVGRAGPRMIEASNIPVGKGALNQVVQRVAPQAQKYPMTTKRHHLYTPGPTKAPGHTEILRKSDRAVTDTGEGLRRLVGKIASGRGRRAFAKGGKTESPAGVAQKKFNKGGKVGTAMDSLQLLAKRLEKAVLDGDEETGGRIRKHMEAIKPGSSKKILERSKGEWEASEKEKNFAKGGKVKATKSLLKSLHRRLQELEGKMAYGELDSKTGRVKGETPEQAKARNEFDRISNEIEKKFGVTLIDDQ